MSVVSFCLVYKFFTVGALNYQMVQLHYCKSLFAVLKIGHIQKVSHFFMLYQIAVVRTRDKLIRFFIVCCMWQFKWCHNK